MKRKKLMAILMITILFVLFVAQNSGSTATKFLFWTWYIPKAMLICISVLGGVILGILSSLRK